MLRTLCPKNHRVYEQSRFARELEDFGCWLYDAGYSRKNICGHVFRLRKVLEDIEPVGPEVAFSVEQLGRAFDLGCSSAGLTVLYRGTERAYERFLALRGRLLAGSLASAPFAPLLDEYRRHLTALRGFTSSTAAQHVSTIADFLARVLGPRESVGRLSGTDVERYLVLKSSEVTRQTLQHTVAHLRAFLRYGFDQHYIPARLDAIDTPRTYRGELPARALPWALVQQLLRSIDRSSRGGWRDYAILHLMAYYGLRPSEIVALRLDSIDWHANTLRVEQRKTRSSLVLPLAERTVSLLRLYLRRGRSPHRFYPQLFLRVRCPAGGLKHTAVCDIFYKRARESGLALESYSSYSLRHAFAMRLLKRGVGLKVIGDLLGHHSLESTCVYLRLDSDTLRAVALPVPRAARA